MRAFLTLLFLTVPALAEPPVIENVTATRTGTTWRFDVTIRHPDTGWEHYADAWRVLDMDGNELGLRVLYHPHVDEQPFTRALTGIVIADGVKQVQVQARDLPHGWNDTTTLVNLP